MFQVFFTGIIGKDAEVKEYSGKKFIQLLVCTSFSKGKGEYEKQYVNVSFWGDMYVQLVKKLEVGVFVCIAGKLKCPLIYQDKVQMNVNGTELKIPPVKKG